MLRLLNIGCLMPPVSVLSAGICYSKPADKNRGTTRMVKEEKTFPWDSYLSVVWCFVFWMSGKRFRWLWRTDGSGTPLILGSKKMQENMFWVWLRRLKKIPDNNHSYLVNLVGCCFFRVVSSYKQSRSSLALEHISLQFSIMSRASLRSPDWKAAFAAK